MEDPKAICDISTTARGSCELLVSASTVVCCCVPGVTTELGPDPEISSVGISTPAREANDPKCGSAVAGIFNAGTCTPAREADATPGMDSLTSGGPSIALVANAMGILSACCG